MFEVIVTGWGALVSVSMLQVVFDTFLQSLIVKCKQEKVFYKKARNCAGSFFGYR